jgi:hypothetical protein
LTEAKAATQWLARPRRWCRSIGHRHRVGAIRGRSHRRDRSRHRRCAMVGGEIASHNLLSPQVPVPLWLPSLPSSARPAPDGHGRLPWTLAQTGAAVLRTRCGTGSTTAARSPALGGWGGPSCGRYGAGRAGQLHADVTANPRTLGRSSGPVTSPMWASGRCGRAGDVRMLASFRGYAAISEVDQAEAGCIFCDGEWLFIQLRGSGSPERRRFTTATRSCTPSSPYSERSVGRGSTGRSAPSTQTNSRSTCALAPPSCCSLANRSWRRFLPSHASTT